MLTTNISKKLFLFFTTILICLIFCFGLTSCTPINSQDIMDALMPNVWVFVSHIVASLVLLTLTIWLVWKPTKNSLEKRRNYIANEIRQAEEARKEVYIKLQEIEQEKINTYNRANSIIADATSQAYRKKEAIEVEASLNAKKIHNDAQSDIDKMRIKMKANMQKQVVDIAFSAAETLVKKKYTPKDDYRTINEFIKELDKKDSHE